MFILEVIALIAAALIGITWVAVEVYGWALLSIGVVLAGAYYVFPTVHNFVATVGWKPLVFKFLPLYLLAGVFVAFLKWFFYVWKTASKISDARDEFKFVPGHVTGVSNLDEKTGPEYTATRRRAFVRFYMHNFNKYNHPDYLSSESIDAVPFNRWSEEGIIAELLTPRARKHVDRITFWVLEWPYVIVATIIDDILIKFARNVARFFDWAFTKASRWWVHQVVKDI